MGEDSEVFVGIDTSKLRHAVAIAQGGRGGEVRFLGEIEATDAAVTKLVRRLAAKHGKLFFCYEAGPTGYGLYRLIKGTGERLRCRGALDDAEKARRSGEDQSARCGEPGQTAAGG